MNGSSFVANTASENGGAIRIASEECAMKSTVFERNEAGCVGGAINMGVYVETMEFTYIQFFHNYAFGSTDNMFSHDLYIIDSDSQRPEPNFESVITTHFTNSFIMTNFANSSLTDQSSLMKQSPLQVNGKASSDGDCANDPCKSLSRAVLMMTTSGSIDVQGDTPLTTLSFFGISATIGCLNPDISGNLPTLSPASNDQTITVQSFSTSHQTSLSLESLNIATSSSGALVNSLFQINNGFLILTQISFTGPAAQSPVSLITLTNSSRLIQDKRVLLNTASTLK
ncbi:hypothetical protein BLNAU_4937 [Blattamonas nauphoetae]|uniref:Polymorphic outer membrane protein n=1 Tax=Blattamonas nauphoetae TaxID=2049346 RepID=A0ABQ9Y8M7_9EUKA|nr:hypothetical protein BLNAU_4937 [Blattamonas nauphoetae]